MKKILILFAIYSSTFTLTIAQPKYATKVQKGILSVNTYDKQGNLLHQGTGVYVGANGEAVADYKVFKGASKATVIDVAGKPADVDCVLGADDTYSLVRFSVNTKGNTVVPSVGAAQNIGSKVSAISHRGCEDATIQDTAMIEGKYIYYGLNRQMDEKMIGSPVFNESGSLVGLLHAPMGNRSYVLDIRFKDQLKIEAIPKGSSSVALGNIFIPKSLPETAEEALVYLYFHSRTTSNEEYLDMVNRFVRLFPNNAEGYLRRSTPLIDMLRFDEANDDLQKYLSLVEDKATGNFNVASVIYDKLTLQPEPTYDKWSYDVALQYVDRAMELSAETKTNTETETEQKGNDNKYKTLKAKLLSDSKQYDAALQIYEAMNAEAGGSPAYLFAISMAREGRGDSLSAVLEPLDSAINMMGTPLPREAAPYVMRRGQLLANSGRYREAVLDYNQYCYLLENKVSAVFYYERSQIELNARMYQQALDDINRAIDHAPRNPLYHVEKASLCIRVNMLDDCIQSCQRAIMLNPDIIDAYRILGYAQLQKGDKTSARQNLQKAIDMGDEGAQKIMDTYM